MILLNLLLQLGNPDLWLKKVCIQQIPFLFNGQKAKSVEFHAINPQIASKIMDLYGFVEFLFPIVACFARSK